MNGFAYINQEIFLKIFYSVREGNVVMQRVILIAAIVFTVFSIRIHKLNKIILQKISHHWHGVYDFLYILFCSKCIIGKGNFVNKHTKNSYYYDDYSKSISVYKLGINNYVSEYEKYFMQ